MTITQDLLSLEKKFWQGDEDFYRKNLDDQCLVVFTEMAGVMKNEEIAKMAKGQQWRELRLEDKGLVELTDGAVLLSYEIDARHKDGKPHKAVASSGYVKRNGTWKMAFHQQTPLGPAKGE